MFNHRQFHDRFRSWVAAVSAISKQPRITIDECPVRNIQAYLR